MDTQLTWYGQSAFKIVTPSTPDRARRWSFARQNRGNKRSRGEDAYDDDGTVPSGRALLRMSDDEIIARLTQVRGIGRWTVEMLLLFDLGRPDVWPVAGYRSKEGLHPPKLFANGNFRRRKS